MSKDVIPFTVKVKEHGKDVHMTFSGALDERSELPEFEKPIEGKLRINLGKLTLINSLGCREWVKWLKTFDVKGGIVLEECGTPVVNQMNILVGFLPKNVTVESCFVPYYCESCAKEDQVLFVIKDKGEKAVEAVPESKACPHCGAEMELDVAKRRYFDFLINPK